MTTTKYTPGPWKVNHEKTGKFEDDFDKLPDYPIIQTNFHASGLIKNGPEARIATLDTNGYAACANTGFRHPIDRKEAEANALLMAAAPDLLEALCKVPSLAFQNSELSAWWEEYGKPAIIKAQWTL